MSWPVAAVAVAAVFCTASVIKCWINGRYDLHTEWLEALQRGGR